MYLLLGNLEVFAYSRTAYSELGKARRLSSVSWIHDCHSNSVTVRCCGGFIIIISFLGDSVGRYR
jgi:hypothetical protein